MILPVWVVAAISLASGIVIVAGSVVAIALWQVGLVRPVPLTDQERYFLEDNFRGGRFVDSGTYRTCINGREYFFYSNGRQATYDTECWK